MQILKLASLPILFLLAACGTTEKSMHSGDRIQNPNRIVTGAHVRIVEVGEGDKRYDTTQSFKGVVCTVGAGGLRNDWSDGL